MINNENFSERELLNAAKRKEDFQRQLSDWSPVENEGFSLSDWQVAFFKKILEDHQYNEADLDLVRKGQNAADGYSNYGSINVKTLEEEHSGLLTNPEKSDFLTDNEGNVILDLPPISDVSNDFDHYLTGLKNIHQILFKDRPIKILFPYKGGKKSNWCAAQILIKPNLENGGFVIKATSHNPSGEGVFEPKMQRQIRDSLGYLGATIQFSKSPAPKVEIHPNDSALFVGEAIRKLKTQNPNNSPWEFEDLTNFPGNIHEYATSLKYLNYDCARYQNSAQFLEFRDAIAFKAREENAKPAPEANVEISPPRFRLTKSGVSMVTAANIISFITSGSRDLGLKTSSMKAAEDAAILLARIDQHRNLRSINPLGIEFHFPTPEPTGIPTGEPSNGPTGEPSGNPTGEPTRNPSGFPTENPTGDPTKNPSSGPTGEPSGNPTGEPTGNPSGFPTENPTGNPTGNPTQSPSYIPTFMPVSAPSSSPSDLPSMVPVMVPSTSPSGTPTRVPTWSPTKKPTTPPTMVPTDHPSADPTKGTFTPTFDPTKLPTVSPTFVPTHLPSGAPTVLPTYKPTTSPTGKPSFEATFDPTSFPTEYPTNDPTKEPTKIPSWIPTMVPSVGPTGEPTNPPTLVPTMVPSVGPTGEPTVLPTFVQSVDPSGKPTVPPTLVPSDSPTADPSGKPSFVPTFDPTKLPTITPIFVPTNLPSGAPTILPTYKPTVGPSGEVTLDPTFEPSQLPTEYPTSSPSETPTQIPSYIPTMVPSVGPTGEPTNPPTMMPTMVPSVGPTGEPTNLPTVTPINPPTVPPTMVPSTNPSDHPTFYPTFDPTKLPTIVPTYIPTDQPTNIPSYVIDGNGTFFSSAVTNFKALSTMNVGASSAAVGITAAVETVAWWQSAQMAGHAINTVSLFQNYPGIATLLTSAATTTLMGAGISSIIEGVAGDRSTNSSSSSDAERRLAGDDVATIHSGGENKRDEKYTQANYYLIAVGIVEILSGIFLASRSRKAAIVVADDDIDSTRSTIDENETHSEDENDDRQEIYLELDESSEEKSEYDSSEDDLEVSEIHLEMKGSNESEYEYSEGIDASQLNLDESEQDDSRDSLDGINLEIIETEKSDLSLLQTLLEITEDQPALNTDSPSLQNIIALGDELLNQMDRGSANKQRRSIAPLRIAFNEIKEELSHSPSSAPSSPSSSKASSSNREI